MTVTTLRLERIAPWDVDRHLAELGALRLVRADGGLWVALGPDAVGRAVAMLARAGLRASAGAPEPPTRGLVAAIVAHLEPLGAPAIVDVVTIRSVGDGEATARLARRGIFRRDAERDAIRSILTGADRAFAWRRAVYAKPSALRRLRGVRPVVFDRAALDRAEERLAFVGRSALTRWIA